MPRRSVLDECAQAILTGSGADTRAARHQYAVELYERTQAYPQQLKCLELIGEKKLATLQANRRAGKTAGVSALIEGRLVRRDNYVVRVLTHVLRQPSKTWLESPDKESFLDRLRRHGLIEHAKIERAQGSVVTIKFAWGSELHVHDVATMRAIGGHHGISAHLWWVDEAQHVDLLGHALATLVYPTLADSRGQVILTGTPGREIDGVFFNAATDDASQWAQARCWSWQNPHFGDNDEERWTRLVDETIAIDRHRYGLSHVDVGKIRSLTSADREHLRLGTAHENLQKWFDKLDPDLRRQQFGCWVVGGADLVFRWFPSATDDPPRYWLRDPASPWECDVPVAPPKISQRLELLPKRSRLGRELPRQWNAVVSCDLGWNPSSTAIVVVIWSDGMEYAYVLWAEEAYEQPDDVTLERLIAITDELRIAGVAVHRVVADVNGTRKGTGAAWSHQFRQKFGGTAGEWISEAQKTNKELQIREANLDLSAGRWRFVCGDPLDVAGRHLRWKATVPGKKPSQDKFREVVLPDGRTVTPGDHTLDSWRYSFPFVPVLQRVDEAPPQTELERAYSRTQELDDDE